MEISSNSIRTNRKAVIGLALGLIPIILSCVFFSAMFFLPRLYYGRAWMAFGIIWIYIIYPIPGVIGFFISHKSLTEIEKSGEKGKKLAKTGRIIGAISVVMFSLALFSLLASAMVYLLSAGWRILAR